MGEDGNAEVCWCEALGSAGVGFQWLHEVERGLTAGRGSCRSGGDRPLACCETTARDAFVRDFRVFFAVDATATVDATLHLASLQTLAYGFAYLDETEGLAGALTA